MGRILQLFSPDENADRVVDIDLGALASSGFEALMLDLDNTLLPWQSSQVPPDVRGWIERAKGMGMKLVILSNTHNPRRLARIASDLGIPSVHGALKPRKAGFARASALIGSPSEHTVVVGDQVLTDILGGNLAGMRTILVKPMSAREFIGTKVSRLIERCIFALLRRAEAGTKSKPGQSQTRDTR